ncbi:hypothetical protein AK812_SmicGene32057 [Symbiodinium microadriaticum]|uniref:NACHT domain-containing protein n=1 Tax=Symbiodinium microadriaticum TaxID=2951 RepID=A0A1Q9CV46_SYMMI|nr:hypothetical protein AK812_SmicGene32057 [Symbiodinium microadriaticum]
MFACTLIPTLLCFALMALLIKISDFSFITQGDKWAPPDFVRVLLFVSALAGLEMLGGAIAFTTVSTDQIVKILKQAERFLFWSPEREEEPVFAPPRGDAAEGTPWPSTPPVEKYRIQALDLAALAEKFEFLERRVILLTGPEGAGKTTTCRFFCRFFGAPGRLFAEGVALLGRKEMELLFEKDGCLQHLLAKMILDALNVQAWATCAWSTLTSLTRNRRWLLVLDGIDLFQSDKDIERLRKPLEDLLCTCTKLCVVLTRRSSGEGTGRPWELAKLDTCKVVPFPLSRLSDEARRSRQRGRKGGLRITFTSGASHLAPQCPMTARSQGGSCGKFTVLRLSERIEGPKDRRSPRSCGDSFAMAECGRVFGMCLAAVSISDSSRTTEQSISSKSVAGMLSMWMRRAAVLMLGAGTHAAVVLQKNTYNTSGCTGQVVRTEYMVTGCVQNGGGSGFAAVSCNSTGASLAMHTDAACASNTTEEQSFDLSTCIDEYNKYMSCTEQTVVTMKMYTAAGCNQANLEAEYSLPLGCRAMGRVSNGQVTAMSQKLELNSNNNLVNKMYNSSLDCSGTHVEVELPCEQVCVDGNTSDALPEGWFAYQGSCTIQGGGVAGATGLSVAAGMLVSALAAMVQS